MPQTPYDIRAQELKVANVEYRGRKEFVLKRPAAAVLHPGKEVDPGKGVIVTTVDSASEELAVAVDNKPAKIKNFKRVRCSDDTPGAAGSNLDSLITMDFNLES